MDVFTQAIWHEHAEASGELTGELLEILEKAIDLRNHGHNEESWTLLNQYSVSGIRNPWLADNMARCLVNLGRKEEAISIWESLIKSKNSDVAEEALKSVTQLKSGDSEYLDLSGSERTIGFTEYAHSNRLAQRFMLLRSRKEYASVTKPIASIQNCIDLAIKFRGEGKLEQSLLVLLLTANKSKYNPWIEDNLARLACEVEDWRRAREHWLNIIESSNDINATETALEEINILDESRKCEKQATIESFGHLLFEEASISSFNENSANTIDPIDCAKRFWNYDHAVDKYLTPEINKEIWEDCMGEDLRHAARYLLRAKLYNGLSFLASIVSDGRLKFSAIKKRCSAFFDHNYYSNNRPDLDAKIDPLDHFLMYGWKEGSDPSPFFSVQDYTREHELCGVNPLYHSICFPKDSNKSLKKIQELSSVNALGKGKILSRQVVVTNNQSLSAQTFQNSTYFDSSRFWKIYSKRQETRQLNIHFVIPDFSKGGGGHMTIFRMIRYLEEQSHKVCVWVINPDRSNHSADLREDVLKHFQPVRAKVIPLDSSFHFSSGDCIVATSWQTVEYVKNALGFTEKFYFIQDYEPYFYARGTNAVLAEQSYRQDLACICASPWLDKIMKNNFHRWSRYIWLAYDKNIYQTNHDEVRLKYQNLEDDSIAHIAVYARTHTERRCVELALKSLEYLSKINSNFVVHFFGDDNLNVVPTYPSIDHGILCHEDLSKLYQDCTIGLSFSATNYSLLPQEMMAAGLPVFDLKVDSTESIYPNDVINLMEPDPECIASTLNRFLANSQLLKQQALLALDWVTQFSWERAGNDFEKALLERLSESDCKQNSNSYTIKLVDQSPSIDPNAFYKASIVIPTYNGGEVFRQVLQSISNQQTPWSFQCLIIDSGSSDETLDVCHEYASKINSLSVYSIPKNEFQHGFTRNVGVDLSSSEFVSFITQDAIPANDKWLYNLVNALESTPNAAGAFGRHIAHDDADPFTKAELKNHFKGFDQLPVSLSLSTDKQLVINDSEGWRKILHFYSDNNSCLRKSVWDELPLPCVPYGEDQLWADMLIRNGYEKLYVKDAVVKHSHDYSLLETYERSSIEAEFFSSCFGYNYHPHVQSCYNSISSDLMVVLKEAVDLECTPEQTARKSANIYAKHLGWLKGCMLHKSS